MSTSAPVAVALAILLVAVEAAPYSKYGRSCKDIGCRSDEVCVMAEDPCSLYQRDACGRYPTCQRSSHGGGESCTTKICPTGQYCKTENGRPTCVNTTPALIDEMFAEDDGGEVKDLTRRNDDAEKPSANSGGGNPSESDPSTSSPLKPAPSYPSGSGYPGSNPAPSYPGAGYPSGSGYPSGGSAYPSASGYPTGSAYPTGQGYPAGQNYPTGQGYSSGNSGYPPVGAGYPNYASRTSSSMNNAGYQGQGQYPGPNQSQGQYPGLNQGQGQYPGPNQGQGQYPGPNPYNNPYGAYPPQTYPGPPQGGYYGPPTTTKKPSITDQLTSYAKKIAKQVLTQALIDKVSGRN